MILSTSRRGFAQGIAAIMSTVSMPASAAAVPMLHGLPLVDDEGARWSLGPSICPDPLRFGFWVQFAAMTHGGARVALRTFVLDSATKVRVSGNDREFKYWLERGVADNVAIRLGRVESAVHRYIADREAGVR